MCVNLCFRTIPAICLFFVFDSSLCMFGDVLQKSSNFSGVPFSVDFACSVDSSFNFTYLWAVIPRIVGFSFRYFGLGNGLVCGIADSFD